MSTRRGARTGAVPAALLLAATLLPAGCGTATGEEITLYHPPARHIQALAEACNERADGRYRIVVRTLPLTGAQYEGLVVQYTSLVAAAGGRILSEGGERVVLDGGAVRGLAVLQRIATSGVRSPGLARAKEGDVYRAFAAAESAAAFQVNWPLALAATRDLNPERAANLAATTYPGVRPGRPGKSTIGGVNLGVSAYSGKPRQAFEAAKCLRGAESQKFAAICGGAPPAVEAIYRDPAPLDSCPDGDWSGPLSMAAAYPMRDVILRAVRDAAVRPATPAYQNLSTVMAKVLSPPGDIDPPATARRLREELTKAIASRGILP